MLGLLRAASKGCVGSVPTQPFLHEDQDSQEEPVAPIAPDRFRCSPFACGRKGPTNGNGKLVRPASEARCGERSEHGRAAGFRNGKGIGVRNAAFRAPKAPGHPRLRDAQDFRSSKDSGRPKIRVIQGFGSPNVSGRSRFQVVQGFGPPKDSGHPRLQVAQISGFHASLMKNRKKKKGGYSLFSTIEFDADAKKSLFRESRASFLLYLQRNCP